MAIDNSVVARVVGIDVEFATFEQGNVFFLPQRAIIVGQGSETVTYATTPLQISDAQTAGETYGFGSPIHLAAKELYPVNGDSIGSVPVTVYPLQKDGAAVVAAGDITPVGAQTTTASYRVRISGVLSNAFTLAAGDTVADAVAAIVTAINGVLDMPVVATDNASTVVDLTAKWLGLSGNDINIAVEGVEEGIVFGVTQPAGGLVNPDVDDALANIGSVWETMVVNCFEPTDAATLNKYQVFADPRWGDDANNPDVTKPLVVITGEPEADLTTAELVTANRTTDRVNVIYGVPGSSNLPLQIAARAVARMARVANNNPPQDYAGQIINFIEQGTVSDFLTFPERDRAVKAGLSTVELEDGLINMSDTVTPFRPDGDPTPAYRYVVDIAKLQNIIYNVSLIFRADEWNGAPLIPDDQPTVNPTAKKPKDAVSALSVLSDNLGLNAIISDPEFSKANTTAAIDSQNPKRLNVIYPVKLSGNTNIIDVGLKFGFFFGGND